MKISGPWARGLRFGFPSEIRKEGVVFLSVFILFFSLSVRAETGVAACFAEASSISGKIGAFWRTDEDFTDLNLVSTCEDISEEGAYGPPTPAWRNDERIGLFEALILQQPTSWREDFDRLLKERSSVADVATRIRKTYETVNAGFAGMIFRSGKDPEPLSAAKQIGVRGSGVKKTAVLAYALLKVRRETSEYSIRFLAGELKKGDPESRRSWVRVALGTGASFDLDPSLSGSVMSPLIPRKAKFAEGRREADFKECMSLRRCLLRAGSGGGRR